MKKTLSLLALAALMTGGTVQESLAQRYEYCHRICDLEPSKVGKKQTFVEQTVVDAAPVYRQWQQHSVIDKIEYRKDKTIVHYRYTGGYGYITLHPPGGRHPWLLQDQATGKVYASTGIYNVRRDGALEKAHLPNGKSHDIYGSHTTITCEVHFPALPYTVKKMDFIEGKGCETYSNHFHAFDIAVNLPQPKAQPQPTVKQVEVLEVPVEIEPAPVAEESPVSKLSAMENAVECNLFPNPTADYANIELPHTETARLQIFTAGGQLLRTELLTQGVNRLDVKGFAAGTYMLHINTGGQTIVKSLVIQ